MLPLRHSPARLQFSLRSLLALTAIVAAYFCMATTVGYLEASGTAAGLVFLVSALRWHTEGLLRCVRLLIVLGALALLWLVAVDFSWFRDLCEDCWLDRDDLQFRVYHIPIYRTNRDHGILHRVAEDLGAPCPHERSTRTYLLRAWGLAVPQLDPMSGRFVLNANVGTLRLDHGSGWYDETAARIVRAKAESSPGLADEFRQRVFVDHDRQYIRSFLAEIKQSREQPQVRPPTDPLR